MSQTIDTKVVEMRFDNANFEANVSQSISTLDRLKASLHLGGAAKGIQNIQTAVNRVDMSPLSNAIVTVQSKFSALDAVAFSALQRITNQAMNAGENLVKSLSIDNIQAGWAKFGEKTQSVATLVAQGYGIDAVNEQLDRLNWYTDETSYNFTDMVSNISKFTAAGQDLESSVTAMEGIANWAALSGQNAATASRAMYQLSQAMAAGKMRYEDFRSIQNASMDTQEFRQHCLDAAVALGTLQKTGEKTYRALGDKSKEFDINGFTSQLTEDEWLTSDVMMKVFNEYSSAVDQIYEYAEEHGVTASEAIEALSGTVDEFGLKAFLAGQEARTFGDTLDSIRDAVSTGWMNIFETVFGDYSESSKLWTAMANDLYEVFATPINNIDELLSGAFDGFNAVTMDDIVNLDLDETTWTAFQKVLADTARAHGVAIDEMIEKDGSFEASLEEGWLKKGIFQEALDQVTGKDVTEKIESTAKSLGNLREIATAVIRGDYGNGQERIDKLTEAGYDATAVQNYVNTIHELTNGTWDLTDAIFEEADARAGSIESIVKMGDEELKTMGYTEEEIKSLRDLAKQAEETGTPLSELYDKMNKPSGRQLFAETITGSIKNLLSAIELVKDAWRNVFPPVTSSNIYNIVKGLHSFVTETKMSDANLSRLRHTLMGVFSIVDIVAQGFEALGRVFGPVIFEALGSFGEGLLRVGSALGKFFIDLDRAIKESDLFSDVLQPLATALSKLFSIIGKAGNIGVSVLEKTFSRLRASLKDSDSILGKFVDKIKNSRIYQTFSKALSEAYESFNKFLDGVDTDKVVDDIFNFFGNAGEKIQEFIDKVKNFEPVEKMIDILEKAGKSIDDFVKSISSIDKNGKLDFGQTFRNMGESIRTAFIEGLFGTTVYADSIEGALESGLEESIDNAASNVAGGKVGSGLQGFADNLWKTLVDMVQSPGKGITEAFDGIINTFARILTGSEMEDTSSIRKLLITAGGFMTLVKIFKGIGSTTKSILQLPNTIKSFVSNLSLLGRAMAKDLNANAFLTQVKAFALAIATLVGAITVLGSLPIDSVRQGMDAIAHILTMLMIFMTLRALLKKLTDGGDGDGGSPITGPLETLAKGLSKAAKRFATLGGIGVMFAGVGAGVLMIASAIEKLNKINWKESSTGVTALIFIVGGLAAVCALIGASTKTSSMMGAAATILALTLAINALMIPIGILSMMSWGKLLKGAGALGALIVALGVAVSKMAGNSSLKSAAEIMALALALDMLVPPIVILGNMKGSSLLKGGLAVAGALIALGAAINVIGEGVKDKAVAAIFTMTLALGAMTAMTKILGEMDAGSLIKGVAAIGILLFSLSRSLARVGKNTKDISIKPIVAMTACVTLLSVMVNILGGMNLGDAVQGVAAVEILLWSLTGALKLLSGSKFDASAIIGIVVMTSAVFALTNMVMMLSDLPVEKALASTLGLSALMLSLAGAFKIFSTIPPIGTLFAMLALVASLYTVFFSLAGMGALINKFPAIGEAFNTLGETIGNFIGAIGAGMTNRMPEIGTNLANFATNIKPFLDNGDKIATAMGSFKNMAEAFGDFAFADMIGTIVGKLTGENSIDKFLKIMGPLAVQLGLFGTLISAAKFDETKIAAAEGIGNFVAALYKSLPNVGGWSGTVWGDPDFQGFVDKLAPLGEGLADYANTISGAEFGKNIKKSEELGEFIATLYSQKIPKKGGLSNLVDGIPDIETYLTKIPELAEKLSVYAGVVNTFSEEFGSDAVEKSQSLATFIAGLFKNDIPTEPTGLVAFVTGQKPMIDDFVANIGPLGEGLAEYAKVLNGQKFDDTAIEKSQDLAEFIGKLFSSENFPTIDTSTGFFGFVQSKPDISGFVSNIKPLAIELAKYAAIVSSLGKYFDTPAIEKSEKLAEFYASLNKDYGLTDITETSILGIVKSQNGLGAFGDGLSDLAKGFGKYVTAINEADLNVGNLLVAQMATQGLAGLAQSLKDVKLGGLFEKGTLTGFGENLATFGENLKTYYTHISDFDKGKLDAVTGFLGAMGDLIPMMESFMSVNEDTGQIGTLNLSGFGEALAQLSEPITKFVDDIGKETEEIKTASKGFVEAFVEGMEIPEGTDLSNSATTIIENLQKSLEDADLSTAATTMMEGLTSSITDKSSEVQTAGETIAKELKSGLESNKDQIGNVFRDPLAHALGAVRDKVSSFNSAGVSIATNLYNGMRSLNGSMGSAYSSPLSTALSNVQGYAKSFFTAGYNIGAQLAAGIRSMISQVRSAVDQLIAQANRASSVSVPSGGGGGASGKSSVLGSGGPVEVLQTLSSELPKITLDATKAVMKADSTLNSTLKNISDAIEDKMEIEPKIKPVLDMNSVSSSVNQMQKLFSFQPGPGVLGNLGAIDAAMRGDGQNEASTTDVIDAINALRDAILDATGDTYNVNGVTYDDGTNVSSAIKQLVDAIIVERRA